MQISNEVKNYNKVNKKHLKFHIQDKQLKKSLVHFERGIF